jgi:hypothetical protein
MVVGVQRHAPDALTPGMTQYPLYRRLGETQGRSGRLRKISLPPGFDPRNVQPVAIIRGHILKTSFSSKFISTLKQPTLHNIRSIWECSGTLKLSAIQNNWAASDFRKQPRRIRSLNLSLTVWQSYGVLKSLVNSSSKDTSRTISYFVKCHTLLLYLRKPSKCGTPMKSRRELARVGVNWHYQPPRFISCFNLFANAFNEFLM